MIRKHSIISILLILCLFFSIPQHVHASENARAFMTSFFSTATSDLTHASNGFRKLNYSTTTHWNPSRYAILNWTNSGGNDYSNNNYAFYISTHGSSNEEALAGNTYFTDNYLVEITPDDITGNWHFVYIDACNSKRNNDFPVALNITGKTKRAYLGWATTVNAVPANTFNNYFWETYVTHYPLQQAAINAAANVPGSGTTPIRFSGDTSWYGYAN